MARLPGQDNGFAQVHHIPDVTLYWAQDREQTPAARIPHWLWLLNAHRPDDLLLTWDPSDTYHRAQVERCASELTALAKLPALVVQPAAHGGEPG
jgi:hypothetical protein